MARGTAVAGVATMWEGRPRLADRGWWSGVTTSVSAKRQPAGGFGLEQTRMRPRKRTKDPFTYTSRGSRIL
jgi:hypothetical protein